MSNRSVINKTNRKMFKTYPFFEDVKVFQYSFSEAILVFFNRFKNDFITMKFSPLSEFGLKFVKM